MDSISDFGIYNNWANQEITKMVNSVDEEQFNRPIISSFPSIKETLFHIWDAQYGWYKSLIQETTNTFLTLEEENKERIITGINKSSDDLENFTRKFEASGQPRITTYYSSKGEAYHNKTSEILRHVFNHSTYHRGQIVIMFRQLGIENILQTDYIHYLRVKG